MSELSKRIILGDKQAIYEFYHNFSPKIYAYLTRRLPQKEDAQEITQDVFLDAIDSLIFFKEQASLLNWLYKIARNKVADYYRKRRIKSVLLSTMPFLQITTQEINEPEFQYEKEKIKESIEQTFTLLSKRYQEILFLRYEENLSIKNVALTLNLSFKAAESLLFRARKEFRKVYERTTIFPTT